MLRQFAALHRNQGGNESMQTVMIMAVGALIMMAIHSLFKNDMGGKIQGYVKEVLDPSKIKFGQ